ncbi:YncE family protein [Actinomadura madurae]|uniref:YncE family protein n=1 Tax=Actinomadura madurae TaxID=1993 RepID=UPI0020D24433|nr:YncE family protein [Actinomadura madurae]MCP9954098.1 YncE family protein [Actinomadura madurae]MCP9970843.1 YncE family protein [Actinomadura madurae]MCP9983323.1 YncE family protein [Actinomadura madurae]MCQ0005115.1 YncE family protein [Actinomadura madurae]MCQ0019573.1 YncE family protein [Actinomadura madurae]
MPSRSLRRGTALLAAAVLAMTAITGAIPARAAGPLRDVMAVGNGQGGTVSFIDTATYANLGSINVVPDLQERLDAMTPVERIGYETVNAAQGYRKLVDDMAVSPDGSTIYVSRGALSDAVAFDIASKRMLWRRKTEGFKADHAALSPDGTWFIVSATTASKAEVIDTATGELETTFATGTYPHANDYSPDGRIVYNSSIGVTSLPKLLNGLKGSKAVTAVDASTFRPLRTYTFEYGIRPAAFTRDNRTMYAQLSYLNGFVEYDLTAGRITRTVRMPFSDKAAQMKPDDYPQNSAHHGMAMNPDESKLCVAGTIDDYVSIVSRPGLTTDGTVHYPTDALPYWTQTSPNGRDCFVSLAEEDQVSVVDYRTAREVARIDVGRFPQRERAAKLTAEAVASLDPARG